MEPSPIPDAKSFVVHALKEELELVFPLEIVEFSVRNTESGSSFKIRFRPPEESGLGTRVPLGPEL